MLDDLVDSLDREFRLVTLPPTLRSAGASLIACYSFHDFIRRDPRSEAAFADLLEEARAQAGVFCDRNLELVARAVELRCEVPGGTAALNPESRDAHWQDQLAHFDSLSKKAGLTWPWAVNDPRVSVPAVELSRILHDEPRAMSDKWKDAVRGLSKDCERLELDAALWSISSVERSVVRFDEAMSMVTGGVREHPLLLGAHSVSRALDLALGRIQSSTRDDSDGINRLTLDDALIKTYHAIRARLGRVRSRIALVRRFALRCALYDGDRLRAMLGKRGSKGPRKNYESLLADELAKYLFDHGLNPLTQPIVAGGLRPDMLDVSSSWTLYVEAKQYSSRTEARKNIVGHMPQVWDTLGRIQDHPNPVREAFYVIFRVDGPHVILPPVVRSGGICIYPVLVDVGDPSVSGSQQNESPLSITANELMPTEK